MTDLSKVPDLELRQKIKPLCDRLDAIDEKLEAMRKVLRQQTRSLNDEHDKLSEELADLLGTDERSVVGTCSVTGLPILDDDETVDTRRLACVA